MDVCSASVAIAFMALYKYEYYYYYSHVCTTVTSQIETTGSLKTELSTKLSTTSEMSTSATVNDVIENYVNVLICFLMTNTEWLKEIYKVKQTNKQAYFI